jgi:hypothetical protein
LIGSLQSGRSPQQVERQQCGSNFSTPSTREWPIEGAHFEEFVASKLPVDPMLPTTGLEQADRQPLLRQ